MRLQNSDAGGQMMRDKAAVPAICIVRNTNIREFAVTDAQAVFSGLSVGAAAITFDAS